MVKYASMKDRTYALIIDLIFVSGLSFITGMILSLISLLIPPLSYVFFSQGWGIFCGLIILWIYFAYMESSSIQATVGKRVMRLKVTDIKYRKISFSKASIRFFSKILSFGFVPNDKGQEYHDKLTGCLVIKE